jgi:hypothetical protein
LMSLSRAQQPMADLFPAGGAQEPSCIPANLTSAPAAGAANGTDNSSPRHVLPKDLCSVLKQLDDLELDRLLAATLHELQRRGGLLSSEPAVQPAARIDAHDREPVLSTTIEESSGQWQPDASAVALTRGQVNVRIWGSGVRIPPSAPTKLLISLRHDRRSGPACYLASESNNRNRPSMSRV